MLAGWWGALEESWARREQLVWLEEGDTQRALDSGYLLTPIEILQYFQISMVYCAFQLNVSLGLGKEEMVLGLLFVEMAE